MWVDVLQYSEAQQLAFAPSIGQRGVSLALHPLALQTTACSLAQTHLRLKRAAVATPVEASPQIPNFRCWRLVCAVHLLLLLPGSQPRCPCGLRHWVQASARAAVAVSVDELQDFNLFLDYWWSRTAHCAKEARGMERQPFSPTFFLSIVGAGRHGFGLNSLQDPSSIWKI